MEAGGAFSIESLSRDTSLVMLKVVVEGSRAFRAFDDFLLPPAAFACRRQDGDLGLAVPDQFEEWRDRHMAARWVPAAQLLAQ